MIVKSLSFILIFSTNIFFISCHKTGGLTFVIDDTKSMESSLNYVKDVVNAVLKLASNEKSEDPLLVTFNDPDIKLHNVSKDLFRVSISQLNGHGGHDCLEYTLTGIELGLNSSKDNSVIFVFTDVSPKDYHLAEKIKQSCQEKNTQIIFVTKPDPACMNWERTFNVFNEIASACSGQVLRLRRNRDAEMVLPYLKESILGSRINLRSEFLVPKKWKTVEFSIGGLMDYAIISASGDNVDIDYESLSAGSYEPVTWIANIKVLKVTELGHYVVRVRADTEASVDVFAKSSINFDYRFSFFPPKHFEESTNRPWKGSETYMTIATDKPINDIDDVTVNLLDEFGNIIKNISIEKGADFFTSKSFTTPNNNFRVGITFKTPDTNKVVTRISNNPVHPMKPEGPYIEDKHYYILQGASFLLNCSESPLTGDIQWYKNDVKDGNNSNTYYIEHASQFDSGNYTCKSGRDGKIISKVNVDVGYIPRFIYPPTDVIEWTEEYRNLDCSTQSKPEAQYEWFFNNQLLKNERTHRYKYTDWGVYTCRATNVHGVILRNFRIVSESDCVFKTVSNPNLPVLVNQYYSWPMFTEKEQFYILPANETLHISCQTPNTFVNFPETSELEADCYQKDLFTINEQNYKFSDLNCNKPVTPRKIKDKNVCWGINTELISIGYNINTNNFVKVFEVCYDKNIRAPLFTKADMTVRKLDQIEDSHHDKIVELSLGKYIETQLVNVEDVTNGPAQSATFDDEINKVLVKLPEANNMMDWNSIEVALRKLYKYNQNIVNLTTWTGVSDVITRDKHNIPTYIWKVVRLTKAAEDSIEDAMAIVYINVPQKEVVDYDKFCQNSCDDYIETKDDENIFCCDIPTFTKLFNTPDYIGQ